MNECYHNSWLTGWMYEGDMRLFCFWNHADFLSAWVGGGESEGRPGGLIGERWV